MPDRGDGILNRILDDVLSKGGTNALSKTRASSAPFVGAITKLLDPGAGPGAQSGAFTEGIFYVPGAVGM